MTQSLLRPALHEQRPSYSPDGQKIVFLAYRQDATPLYGQLYTIRRDGTQLTQLTSGEYENNLWLHAWAPNPAYKPVGCGADMNCSGTVDLDDLHLWRHVWADPTNPNHSSTDLDTSNSTNILDYLLLFHRWLR